MQKKAFVSKVFQMSSVMLFLNISGICYSIFISKKAGAAAIGMFHLCMSVYSLAQVISISGIGLTATRLLSDMPLSLASRCADGIVVKCIKMCLVPSVLAGLTLFYTADFLAENVLFDPRCAFCLKILAPTLCCVAASSVINGYFTAFGKIKSISAGKFVSDASLWATTIVLLERYPSERTYIPVVIGFSVSFIVQTVCDMLIWSKSRTHLYCHNATDYKSIIRLCAPIALGSYLRTGLTGAENILIPSMLALFGIKNPVASYGIIKGMTMPILMFPMVFTGAFTTLIVPEIARRRSLGYKNGIKYISSMSVEYILKFAFFVSAVFFKWHKSIALSFFDEPDSWLYMGFLFALPVFLFLDSVVDSILKGLDEQVASLKINIIDSFFRVVFIVVFVPRWGMIMYIVIMYISEIVNLSFSYLKLKKASGIIFPLKKSVFEPILAVVLSFLLLRIFSGLGLWSEICLFGFFYIVSLSILARVD